MPLLMSVSFKGIQAQTVANFYLAFEAQLTIIPVINKVIRKLLGFDLSGRLSTLKVVRTEQLFISVSKAEICVHFCVKWI